MTDILSDGPARDLTKFLRLRRKAAEGGAEQTGLTLDWDISGGCLAPVGVTHVAAHAKLSLQTQLQVTGVAPADARAYAEKHANRVSNDNPQMYVNMSVPCRKCKPCLKARARLWTNRARIETKVALRTWFCTFTLRPTAHHTYLMRARQKYSPMGDFEILEPLEQFTRIHNEIGKDFTKYFKRLRKHQDKEGGLRYLLVCEAHKSGLPHYHALIHEYGPAIGKRIIQGNWQAGFSSAKLADEKSAFYVTKYLSKDILARVRASKKYGQERSVSYSEEVRTTKRTERSEDPTPNQPPNEVQEGLDCAQ